MTAFAARLIERHGNTTLALFAVLAVSGAAGISFLTVENRFIDYFKKSTEIYQGMLVIDRRLGGTVTLDIILDKPEVEEPAFEGEEDPFGMDAEEVKRGAHHQGVWFADKEGGFPGSGFN